MFTFIIFFVFFFNDTATTEIYTLSLHDALPIYIFFPKGIMLYLRGNNTYFGSKDRKSTRLNSSHLRISYAVFCLKKKTTRLTSRRGTIRHFLSRRVRRDAWRWHVLQGYQTGTTPGREACLPQSLLFFFLKERPPPHLSSFPIPYPLLI